MTPRVGQDDFVWCPPDGGKPEFIVRPLTRREQFAMAAMQGILASPNSVDVFLRQSAKSVAVQELGFNDTVAQGAALLADALIAELDKERE